MLAHALFPQIPKGVIPVIVQKLAYLRKMRGFHGVDILAQLFKPQFCWCCAVRMVTERPQLSNNTAEAMHKACRLAFQRGNGLLFLQGSIGGRLEEAPTPRP